METAAEASNSKVTPIKPHFFKPVLPGFLHIQLIPVAFFENYLNNRGKWKNRDAVLRTVLGEWKVKIKDGKFQDGWGDFADRHSLHVGDFVVFRYEGDFVFDVMVFDPTACERDYENDRHQNPPLDVKQESPVEESTDDDLQRSKKKVEKSARASRKEVASSSSGANPSFTATLKPYSLIEHRIFLPMAFARSNDLCNRRCEMLIVDDQETKSWPVTLNNKSGGVYISGDGCRDLIAESGLKVGDDFSFMLISDGTKPVMVFQTHHRSKKAIATPSKAMKLPSQASQHLKVKKEPMKVTSKTPLHFISTVTRASIDRSYLTIPNRFARLHDLQKYSKMTVRDSKDRLWSVSLTHEKFANRIRAKGGWREVALANKLQPGQEIKLELDQKGELLMMNMSVCGGSKAGRSGLCKEEELVTIK